MRSKPPHVVALTACWIASYGVTLLMAWLDAGLAAWLQGTIYLLAGTLLGIGAASILRYVYFDLRAGYRQGILYLIAACVFAGHGYFRIREHRAALARDETQVAPVVDAVRKFQKANGTLPPAIEQLGMRQPDLPRFRYEPRSDQSFQVSFHHDVIVAHVYDSSRESWHDELHPP